MNQWELQKYHLTTNSRGQVVRVVKQLLHSNPRNSYQMNGTDIFDTELQSAVAEFQRTLRLPNTSGTLDSETWAALGANMLPAQINIVSLHDSNIRVLLDGNSGGRGLSADEIKLAQIMYKTSIDYTQVRVHKGKYGDLPYGYGQPDTTLMTPNGEIYAPPNVYSSDYASESDDFKSLFIHEMCHVWQWQRNIKNVKTAAVIEWAWHGGDYDAAYYYKLEDFKDFKEFGLEQQAMIVEDYYRIIKINLDYAKDSKGKTRNLNYPDASRTEIKNLLYKATGKFMDNPSY